MKIKFNLKTGLSLTEEETKEYLKVAGDVATKLFSTKTEKKETGVKPVSSSCIKTYADLDLKKIADEAVKEAIHSMHVFSAAKPGDERIAKNIAMRIFHKKTGLGYCVAEQVINDAYCRNRIFSYDDRTAEEIRDAHLFCLKKSIIFQKLLKPRHVIARFGKFGEGIKTRDGLTDQMIRKLACRHCLLASAWSISQSLRLKCGIIILIDVTMTSTRG